MNTYEKIILRDGKEIQLTLNFARLLKVKNDNKNIYEKYNNAILNGTKDVFDMVDIIYTAYLCANIGEEVLEYNRFIELIPESTTLIARKVQALTSSKKK